MWKDTQKYLISYLYADLVTWHNQKPIKAKKTKNVQKMGKGREQIADSLETVSLVYTVF